MRSLRPSPTLFLDIRKGCHIPVWARLSAFVLVFLFHNCPANAQAVTLANKAVDKSMWVANAIYTVNSHRDYEKPILAAFINTLYRQNPTLKAPTALALINQAQQEYTQKVTKGLPADQYMMGRTQEDLANSMFTILGTLPVPGAGTAAAIAKESLSWAEKQSNATLDAEGKVLGQHHLFNSYLTSSESQNRQWEDLYSLAKTNPNAATTINTFFAPYLNAGTTEAASQILANNPQFAGAQEISAISHLISADGGLATSLDNLKALSGSQFAGIQTVFKEDRALLSEVDKLQTNLSAYIANQQAQVDAQAKVEHQRQLHEAKLDAATSSIYLLSTFVSFGDPKLGRAISVTGGAAIQIAESVSRYTETAGKLGQLGSSLGGAVLAGNIVGAAMNVFSLFNSAPTTEELILNEVTALRKDVNTMRVEMHERFDRIDASLNKIFETLADRFDKIDAQLGTLNANIDEIQRTLYGLQDDLDRLHKNLYSFLNAGFRHDLREALNGAIGYKERTGVGMTYAPEYVGFENKFYTWATSISQDELEAGASNGRSFSDDKVAAELSGQPLEANLNYLAALISNRFPPIPSFASSRLPNPTDWETSAEAYIRLASENLAFFKKINRQRLKDIYNTGLALESSLEKIVQLPAGSASTANRALFDALIASYKDKIARLKPRVENVEAQFLMDLGGQDNYLRSVTKDVNLWAGPGQPTAYLPRWTQVGACPGANTSGLTSPIAVPAAIGTLIPSEFLLAEALSVGKLDICYTALQWLDSKTTKGGYGLGQGCYGQYEVDSGVLGITLKASFQGKTVFLRTGRGSQTIKYATRYLGGVAINCPGGGVYPLVPNSTADIVAKFTEQWTGGEGMKDKFVANSTEQASAAERNDSKSSVTLLVAHSLADHRREYYRKIVDSLSSATLVHDAAKELSGAQKTLEAFLVLGLPRSLDVDDLLRALLYGNERVLDEDGIKELCNSTILQSLKPDASEQKVDIANVLDQRITMLNTHLNDIFKKIDDHQLSESHQSLRITLDHLQAFIGLKL